MSTRLVQDLHAGISRRDWSAVETAANALRDESDKVRRALAATDFGSLPADYPTLRMVEDRMEQLSRCYASPETKADPIEYRNDEAGFVEFINEDRPYIVRDLPAPSAILTDMETRKVIGYRVYDPASQTPSQQMTGTESPWQWWAGSSEEWCTVGPEGSREEIIQAATNDSLGETDDDGSWKLVFHIIEARQDDLRLADWIESDRLLERAEDSMADSDRTSSEYDDGPWFECSPEQEKDLEERIKRACDEWQAAHGLKFSCPTFSHTRNNEVVVVDLAIEALAKGTTEGQPDG